MRRYFMCFRFRVLSIWANLRQILESDEALIFFEAFHAVLVFFNAILGVIIGVHFHFLHVSPLEMHLGIILGLIAATLVYITAYLVIKVKPQNAAYRFIFGLICLVSGIFSAELLLTLIISPLGIFMVSLCPILIIGIGVLYHCYRQIYEDLYNTAGASDATSSSDGDIEMQRAETNQG
ncbi:uncharacterized protein LOC112031662 isoform X1 [Quercus suber]|uniref:uncharacterized protein LOC112031662 isoform X1 n=1 Tax=Quercus suber TaxID=58331 RepID=UPI0032DEE014